MPPLPAHSGGGDHNPSGPLYRPDPSNTRVLLRSLEDLRDSLSARVEQLSGAVDRLRGQASELEHAVNTGSSLSPGFGRPGPSGRIAPLITTFTSVSGPRRPLSLAARRIERPQAGPGPSTSDNMDVHVHVREGQFRGRPPTNLLVAASQPKPIIVRSPAPSVEPDSENVGESRGDLQSSTTDARTTNAHRIPDEPLLPTWPDRALSPLDRPTRSEEEDTDGLPENSGFMPFIPLSDRLPPGLTTRGMMVQERQGLPGETRRRIPMQRETDRAGRDADRLDRAIARYQRRQDESQREYHTAWERERQRGIQGGRLPNEHSVARAEAMRRHVDNAHRLWNLIYQRDRLPPSSADRDIDLDVPDAPLSTDAMRPSLASSPTFLRRNLPPPRRPRRLPSGLGGVGVPASPPLYTTGEIVDHERRWIDRITSERESTERNPTVNELGFEMSRIIQELRAAAARGDNDFSAQTLRMRERLSRLRAWREEGSELVRDDATRASTSPPLSPRLTPQSPTDSPELSPLAPPIPLFESDTTNTTNIWHANRIQLLDFIEESRARVHDMARDLSPDVLAEERPGMRRVLEGIERMLARDTLGSDIRVRLERLAGRERELLGLPPQAAVVPRVDTRDLAPAPVLDRLERMLSRDGLPPAIRQRLENLATLERERGARVDEEPADVLERIDRARARVRELSRISRELASVRADMGLTGEGGEGGEGGEEREEEREERPRVRRDSDADTVVPTNWEREPGRMEEAFRVLSLDGHEVIDLATERVGSGSGSESSGSTSASASGSASGSRADEEKEGESGQLAAGEWVLPPGRRAPRPYVSLLDL